MNNTLKNALKNGVDYISLELLLSHIEDLEEIIYNNDPNGSDFSLDSCIREIEEELVNQYAKVGNREMYHYYGNKTGYYGGAIAEENGHYSIAIDSFIAGNYDLKEEIGFYIPCCDDEQIMNIVDLAMSEDYIEVKDVIAAVNDKDLMEKIKLSVLG